MIPKIIHYCWFGGNPLPSYALKYIESWKKYFADYEIKEWNEQNYDVHKIPYISEAYNAKKYAFVSDYVRFDVLYQCGGIYFDVDVEIIRPFDKILDDIGFIGTESIGAIAAGLGVGCNAGLGVVKEILDNYERDSFLCNDEIDKYNLKTIVERVTDVFKKHGFNDKKIEVQRIADFTIYPPEYFAPENPVTYLTNLTEKSVSIHHYWIGDEKDKVMWATNALRLKYFRKKLFGLFGNNLLSIIILKFVVISFRLKNFLIRLFKEGFIVTFKYYSNRIHKRANKK